MNGVHDGQRGGWGRFQPNAAEEEGAESHQDLR